MGGNVAEIALAQVIEVAVTAVLIHNKEVDIPIIIKIPKSGIPADECLAVDARLIRDFGECPI